MKKWPMMIAACAIPLCLTACSPVDINNPDQTSDTVFSAAQATRGFTLDVASTSLTSNIAASQAAQMVIGNFATLHQHSDSVKLSYAPGSTPQKFFIDVAIKHHDPIRFNCKAKAERKIMKITCQQSS